MSQYTERQFWMDIYRHLTGILKAVMKKIVAKGWAKEKTKDDS